ncbi:MAG: glycosyltransferase family 2 protein [Bacteroidaceae bacterium]
MPIITFIITYYNEPLPLLAECLRSILQVRAGMMARGMREENFEMIVVDDGSRESPREMLAQMDAGIKYVCQTNAGLSAARNAGLALAQGEYVQFVDADDTLLPETYCSLCPQGRADADMILFYLTRQKSDRHKEPLSVDVFPQSRQSDSPAKGGGNPRQMMSGPHYMLHHNVRASACGYIFRKSMLGHLRFAEGLLHEDELFTPMLLLRMHTVCEHQVNAYYYRQRVHTITHSSSQEQVTRRLDSVEEILRRLHETYSTLLSEERQALMRRVEQLAADYIYNVYRLESEPEARRMRLGVLRQMYLMPLPLHFHTLSHGLFSLMTHLPHICMDALMRLLVPKSEQVR